MLIARTTHHGPHRSSAIFDGHHGSRHAQIVGRHAGSSGDLGSELQTGVQGGGDAQSPTVEVCCSFRSRVAQPEAGIGQQRLPHILHEVVARRGCDLVQIALGQADGVVVAAPLLREGERIEEHRLLGCDVAHIGKSLQRQSALAGSGIRIGERVKAAGIGNQTGQQRTLDPSQF